MGKYKQIHCLHKGLMIFCEFYKDKSYWKDRVGLFYTI